MKLIKICGSDYEINYSLQTLEKIYKEITNWMESNCASYCGEAIFQSDTAMISSTELIANIVDNILKPNYIND